MLLSENEKPDQVIPKEEMPPESTQLLQAEKIWRNKANPIPKFHFR